jgi:4-hydroxybenzoate polyprenyltransferase
MSLFRIAVRTWLQLLRVPNLFTVPGDSVAGFLLASGGQASGLMAAMGFASLCFYAYGLLLNDLADLDEDRRERPERPLPKGYARVRTVRIVVGMLAVIALGVCVVKLLTLVVAVVLLGLITSYNLWAKRLAVVGPLNMGLCRGFSLLLGAAAGAPEGGPPWTALVLAAMAGLTLYIALVTHLARIETQANPPAMPRVLPYAGLILAILPFFFVALDLRDPFGAFNVALYAVSAYTLYAGFKIHRRLNREPAPPIPPIIGQLIRVLLPLQAIWCLASRSVSGAIAAMVLLLLWPVSRAVSRRFYAS